MNQDTDLYDKPNPPLMPLLPASMLNTTTRKPLSLDEIRENEADTSSDDDSGRDNAALESKNISQPSVVGPKGRDGELALAEKRVKEMMKMRK